MTTGQVDEPAPKVEGLGLGLLPDTVTGEGMRSLVGQLTSDSSILARVNDMRQTTQRAGGSALAADVVEEELAR